MGRKTNDDDADVEVLDDRLTDADGVAMPGKHDVQIAALLAAGHSQKTVGERLGVSTSTIERRVADPMVRMRIIENHAELRDQLIATSVSAAQAATSLLLSVVNGQHNATLNQRIRAAVALRHGLHFLGDRDGI